jgi:hypothetical protein
MTRDKAISVGSDYVKLLTAMSSTRSLAYSLQQGVDCETHAYGLQSSEHDEDSDYGSRSDGEYIVGVDM